MQVISIALALVLSQVAPTRDQVIGAINIVEDGAIAASTGTITPTTNAAQTRSCLVRPSGVPNGTVTLRFGVVVISPALQRAIGLTLPPGAATWDQARDEYAAMEIQAVPTSTVTFDPHRMRDHLDVIEEEVEVRASPLFPECEIAIARRDDAGIVNLFRCGCSAVPATCSWTRTNPNGTTTVVTPAPIGITFAPGSFSGAGCRRKPCATRYDGGADNSWPAECPR